MPNILSIPVPNGNAAIAWNGRVAPGINSLLFMNPDLNNTVYLGNDPSITANTGARIPIAPNGTFSADPASSWYVVGAAAGIEPLVIVPNGQAYFLGLTQGLGNLAIPSIQSPNFVEGLTGWQVDKNGNAEFNNLTIRGTFYGLDFVINSAGAFFYNGTPALGNLKISIASASGVDSEGNVYKDNITCYDTTGGGGFAQLAANDATGIPYLVLSPTGNPAHMSAPPQITSGLGNGGLVNEYEFLQLISGYGVSPGTAGEARINLYSRSNDQTLASSIQLAADQASVLLGDGNTYNFGKQFKAGSSSIPVTSATLLPINPINFNVGVGSYYYKARLVCQSDQAAGSAKFGYGGTATVTQAWGKEQIWLAQTPAVGYVTGTLPASYVTGTFTGVNENFIVDIDLDINFSAAGTFEITTAIVTAGDTFHILAQHAQLHPYV